MTDLFPYSLKEIPKLKTDFKKWESLMVILFKLMGCWNFIKDQVTLEQIQETNDELRIKEYRNSCLKVNYLLLKSTSDFNNEQVRLSMNEDIFTAWQFLKRNHKCSLDENDHFYPLNLSAKVDVLQKITSLLKELNQISTNYTYIENLVEGQIIRELNLMKQKSTFK